MRRFLLSAILAAGALALVAGCATPVDLGSKPAGSGLKFSANATLATTPCEMSTAAAVTTIANARLTAARKLQAGAFTVAQAQQIQTLADKARASLVLACNGDQVYVPGLTLLTLDVVNLRKTLEDYK